MAYDAELLRLTGTEGRTFLIASNAIDAISTSSVSTGTVVWLRGGGKFVVRQTPEQIALKLGGEVDVPMD